MDIVTIIGVSILGVIAALSLILCFKAYREHKMRVFDEEQDYLAVLEELENKKVDNSDVNSIKMAVDSLSPLRSVATATKVKGTLDNETEDNTNSSLRRAAASHFSREREKDRNKSNDVWSMTSTSSSNNLFATSYDNPGDNCNKSGSVFESGVSNFGSNHSPNDSVFSSSGGDSGGGGCD